MRAHRTMSHLLIGIFLCMLGIVMFLGATSMTPVHDRRYTLAIGEYYASPTAENKCNYLEQYIRKTKTEVNIRYGLLFLSGMLIGMGVVIVVLRRGGEAWSWKNARPVPGTE